MATNRNEVSPQPGPSQAAPKSVEVSRAPDDSPQEFNAGATLPQVQRRVLEKIVAGRSIRAVARDVGVHRNTISQWLRNDPHFQAAYNAWRLELQESARARIAGLTDAAVNVLRRALARDNEQVALALLKGQNLIAPSSIGSTDPDELERHADIAEIDRTTAMRESEAQIGHRRYLISDSDIEYYRRAKERLEAAREAAEKPDSDEPKK